MAAKRPKSAAPKRTRAKRKELRRPPPPAPGATAPEAPAVKAPTASARTDPQQDDIKIARGVALPAMHDPRRRKEWGLPEEPDMPGYYMVELNLRHPEGLDGAAAAFEQELYAHVVKDPKRRPDRITVAYYRCQLAVPEWQDLIRLDEEWEAKRRASKANQNERWVRCIYRIWPDFKIKALIDRSVATVKADAALRSFSASGRGIVWAVVDSGIDATHPHFGSSSAPAGHLLLDEEVSDLHRDFTRPDADTRPVPRANVAAALTDDFGHGTHVAGIIGGCAPLEETRTVAFERVFKATPDDGHDVTLEQRACDPKELRGIAPECKIVSLRVLDADGMGHSSDVIRALAYIRERVNTNLRMPRIHGVNLSVGYEFDAEMFACGQSPICAEVDRLVQSGVVVIAAAGNTGYGTATTEARVTRMGMSNSINDPGNAARAITVGATHREFPHTYGVSYFSSKGPTGDGRLKPDLVAPGERITSCAAGKKLAALPLKQTGGKRPRKRAGQTVAAYVDDSGTSMAAPHVSGAIAAFLSIRREFIGKPDELKRIFLEGATPLGRERYFEGHGLVDLMRTIQSV